MLVRVGLGQSRFNVPGLAADSRGVALGRQWVARFGALDRLVSFMRLWSAEQIIDDVAAGLRIVQVRRETGAREVILTFSVTSTAMADAAARAARMAGGQCFTGSGKQFVAYRDGRAPLGYDVAAIEPSGTSDFVLYGQDQTTRHAHLSDLPLDKLLMRLDLQRDATSAKTRRQDIDGPLFLRVRRGLGPMVVEYLNRAQRLFPELSVKATVCETDASSRFEHATSFWLFRLEGLPPRLFRVLSGTPGLDLFAPVLDHVAIAVGYHHPIHLSGCRRQFPDDKLFLFAAAPGALTVMSPAPVLVPLADLVRFVGGVNDLIPGAQAQTSAATSRALVNARPAPIAEWRVPIRLEAAPSGEGRAVATLIPWRQSSWLRSLVYALPPTALRGYRVGLLERGLLILGPGTLDGFPFGRLFHAPASGLLVPLGWTVRPAVPPELLAARLGAADGAVILFENADLPPVRIAASVLLPLEARILADSAEPGVLQISLATGKPSALPHVALSDIEIENQAVGLMPLWRLGR